MYLTTFYILTLFFHFPAKNNFMLVTQRTERYGGETYLEIIFCHGGFPRLHVM